MGKPQGQDCDESRPTRGGQASDQATRGGQAGTGSNRRTNQPKDTHAKARGQCICGSRPSPPRTSLNTTPDVPPRGNVANTAITDVQVSRYSDHCAKASQCIWSATSAVERRWRCEVGRSEREGRVFCRGDGEPDELPQDARKGLATDAEGQHFENWLAVWLRSRS